MQGPISTLHGRYRVDRLVRQGGYGVVYAGHHLALDAPIAIKILKLDNVPSADKRAAMVASFLEEGRVLMRLRHPNIVMALDLGVLPAEGERGDAGGDADPLGFFSPGAAPYLVMEWVDGVTLADLLAERGAPLSLAETWAIFAPLVEAVAAAHAARVVHRDLKPLNVMIARDAAGRAVPRIIDFGIAKLWEQEAEAGSGSTNTATQHPAFTPAYAAPEQIAHARTGPWTDIHALGLLFTEMVTGERPYGAGGESYLAAVDPERPTPRREGVDVGAFEPVIAKALALRPSDRHRSAGELLDEATAAARAMGLDPGPHEAKPSRAAPRNTAVIAPQPASDALARQTTERASTMEAARPRAPRRAIVAALAALAAIAVAISGAISGVTWYRARRAGAAPSPSARKLRALTQGAAARGVAFSPDGRAIAIGEATRVRVIHDDGRPEAILPADTMPACEPISWLPDGHAIRRGTVAIGLDGKRGRSFSGPAMFSRDGKRYALWSLPGDAFVFDQATDAITRIIKRPEGTQFLLYAEPAPTDDRLLLLTDAGGMRLWIVGAGDERREIGARSSMIFPAWSPRGDAVYALVGGEYGMLDLVKISAAGGAPRVLVPFVAPAGRCNALTISPDGRRAAFMRLQSHEQLVRIVREGDRFVRHALTAEDARAEGPAVSPDGRRLAYVEPQTEGGAVRIMDLATGQGSVIHGFGGSSIAGVAWAPDGKRIALARARATGGITVSLLPVDRGYVEEQPVRCPQMSGDASTVEWLDDHTLIYEGEGNDSIRAVDVTSGDSRVVVAPHDGWIFLHALSPDRRRLMLHWNRLKGPKGFYLMRLPEGTLDHVPESISFTFGAWDGDARLLFFTEAGALVAVDAHTLQRLDPPPAFDPPDWFAAAEGGFIGAVHRATIDAWVAEDFDPDAR